MTPRDHGDLAISPLRDEAASPIASVRQGPIGPSRQVHGTTRRPAAP